MIRGRVALMNFIVYLILPLSPTWAQKADPFSAFRYYEGTWRVEARPSKGTVTGLKAYRVTYRCREQKSQLLCTSHFWAIDPENPTPDYVSRISKDAKNPAVFYERNRNANGQTAPWRIELKPWGKRSVIYMRLDADPTDDPSCGPKNGVRRLYQVDHRVDRILGPDRYESRSYSTTQILPECGVEEQPKPQGLVTWLFQRVH